MKDVSVCCLESIKSKQKVLLLGLVDVGAAFPQVEVHLVSGVTALELQQSCVFTLVSQAALIASKDGLTPQSELETGE